MKKAATITLGVLLGVILLYASYLQWAEGRNRLGGETGNYETNVFARRVVKVADNMGLITRIKGTPDNQQLYVTNLTGDVYVLNREGTQYAKQAEPVYHVNTGFPAGVENGLTGVIISWDWMANHQIFLLYASKEGSESWNHILRLTIVKQGDKYVGADPKIIFTANVPTAASHQIQGGTAIQVEGVSSLLFAMGEAHHPEWAQDVTKQAGKIMLMREDGGVVPGVRPYPQSPLIQAIGVRNSYDLAVDTLPDSHIVYVTENGPDVNDLVLRLPLLEPGRVVNLGWNGTPESMLAVTVDGKPSPESIIKKWSPTVSPTDLVVDDLGRVFVNVFSSAAHPVKEMLMGTKDKNKDSWTFQQIIRRKEGIEGGNLIGMYQTENGDIYFGDLYDGVVYRFTTWGDLKPVWR